MKIKGADVYVACGLTVRAVRRRLRLRNHRSTGNVHREDNKHGFPRRARHCGCGEAECTALRGWSGRRDYSESKQFPGADIRQISPT